MPNEALDVIGDVINPAKGSPLDLDVDFTETTPSNLPASQTQPNPANKGEGVIEDVEIDELREIIAERRNTKVATSFVTDHQADYVATEHNSAVLMTFIDQNNLPFTRESLETAYQSTRAQLETKPSTRQAAVPHKPSSTGVSDSVSQHVETVPTREQVEKHAYEIPLSQLRAEIQQRAFEAGKLGPRSTRFSRSLESSSDEPF